MNQKGFANIIVIIGVVLLAGITGYFMLNRQTALPTPISSPSPSPTPTPIPLSNETKCTDYSIVSLNNDQSFVYTYNNDNKLRAIPETKFEGVLKEYKKLSPGIVTTLQRDLTYNLDGKAISVFSPIDIFVTDQDSNHLGIVSDGSIVNEIPNAAFEES